MEISSFYLLDPIVHHIRLNHYYRGCVYRTYLGVSDHFHLSRGLFYYQFNIFPETIILVNVSFCMKLDVSNFYTDHRSTDWNDSPESERGRSSSIKNPFGTFERNSSQK